MLSIRPKRATFDQMFTTLADTVCEGVLRLVRVLDSGGDLREQVSRLQEVEHRGDKITHDIYTELNRTFITPFDREDMHQLASSLDDVLDYAHTAGQTMITYKIADATPPARQLAGILVQQCEELSKALALMNGNRHALHHCENVSRLEREADTITRRAYAALFEAESDPIRLIKLKDLYRQLEQGTDRADDVANVIETIVLKNA
jgi:predicted phosphate transport protein (TIGR00153 family)